MSEMDMVICLHSEVINSATHVGKCKICGQEKLYNPEHPGKATVTKRGYINGKLTEITPPKKGQRVPEESSPTPFKPPNWDQLHKKQKGKFYDENKDYILKTIEELGRLLALQKLDIHPATYYRLLKRWELKPQGRKKKEKSPTKITGRAKPVEATRLTKEPAPEPAPATEPFHTGPLNKRLGIRALWRF